jgi:hypothetical protein
MVTNSTSKGLPTRTSYSRIAPRPWLCVSMKPGTIGAPLASQVGVPLRIRLRTSVLDPTARKRPFLIAKRVCARLPWIDGHDPGVENDQVGGCGRRVFLRSRKKRRGDKARSGEREQIAAGSSVGHELLLSLKVSHQLDAQRATNNCGEALLNLIQWDGDNVAGRIAGRKHLWSPISMDGIFRGARLRAR